MLKKFDKKEHLQRVKHRFRSLKANGIGSYHAAPAALMVAAGIVLSSVITEPAPGVVNAFASSVSSPISQMIETTTQMFDNSQNGESPAMELNFVPTLYNDVAGLKSKEKEASYDFSGYCTYLSPDAAQKKLDEAAEYNKLMDELSAARGEAVCSGNKNLYREHYGYSRGKYDIPSNGQPHVRYNSSAVPMSGFKVPDNFELDENGIPKNYHYYIDGNATAYSGGGRTSTGSAVRQGVVAVDPRVIPYGTEMYITSLDGKHVYGFCRAEDTGGFIYFRRGATVDLYMDYESDCEMWGWRGVRIYILPTSYK